MGYLIVVKLDAEYSHYQVIECETADERDEIVKIWTDQLTQSYWGRDAATITVYPSHIIEQHEFEIDQVKSKVNNCFKVKKITKLDSIKNDSDSSWIGEVDRQGGSFTDAEIANSREWK